MILSCEFTRLFSRIQLTPRLPLRIQTLDPGSIQLCGTEKSRPQVFDSVATVFSNETVLGVSP